MTNDGDAGDLTEIGRQAQALGEEIRAWLAENRPSPIMRPRFANEPGRSIKEPEKFERLCKKCMARYEALFLRRSIACYENLVRCGLADDPQRRARVESPVDLNGAFKVAQILWTMGRLEVPSEDLSR